MSERFSDGEHSFLELSDQWEYLSKFAYTKDGNLELICKFEQPDSEVTVQVAWLSDLVGTNWHRLAVAKEFIWNFTISPTHVALNWLHFITSNSWRSVLFVLLVSCLLWFYKKRYALFINSKFSDQKLVYHFQEKVVRVGFYEMSVESWDSTVRSKSSCSERLDLATSTLELVVEEDRDTVS